MKEKRLTQTQQVINTLREQGGYATLGNLYHLVDTSTWATKTPNESIRRIVNGEPQSPIHILHPSLKQSAHPLGTFSKSKSKLFIFSMVAIPCRLKGLHIINSTY